MFGTIPLDVNTKQGRGFTQLLDFEVLLELRNDCSVLRTRFASHCHVIHIDRDDNSARIALEHPDAVVTTNQLEFHRCEHLIQLLVPLVTSLLEPIQRSVQLEEGAMSKTRFKTLWMLHVDFMIQLSIQKRV